MRQIDRRGRVVDVETNAVPVMPIATATAIVAVPDVPTTVAAVDNMPTATGTVISAMSTSNPVAVPTAAATGGTTATPPQVQGMLSDADLARMASETNPAKSGNSKQSNDGSALGASLL